MDKIFITGHTSGLGKGIYQYHVNNNHDIFGGSRSNGYNISNYQKILDYIENNNINVFINNAYCGIYQYVLLDKVSEVWKTTNKIIINISSRASDYSGNYKVGKYAVNKKSLDELSRYILVNPEYRLKVITIAPGYIKGTSHNYQYGLNMEDVIRVYSFIWENKKKLNFDYLRLSND